MKLLNAFLSNAVLKAKPAAATAFYYWQLNISTTGQEEFEAQCCAKELTVVAKGKGSITHPVFLALTFTSWSLELTHDFPT